MATEKRVLKNYGSRPHPRSGAGKIKADGSNEQEVIEVKDAAKSFSLKVIDLQKVFKQAVSQNKEPVMIVNFDHGYQAVIEIRRIRNG